MDHNPTIPILPKNRIPLKQAAADLDVSYRTITRWRAEGRLATWKIGGRVYTTAEAIAGVCCGPTAQRRISDSEARKIMREALA